MIYFHQGYFEEVYRQNVNRNYRTVVAITGSKTEQHVPLIYDKLKQVSPLNSIIWCYGNNNGFEEAFMKGKANSEKEKTLKWMNSHAIERISYRDSGHILGQTCDMLILQDLEDMMANTAATCIETVRGGGVIILHLGHNTSVSQLTENLADFHFGTNKNVFNTRLVKLLINSKCCLFLNSEMDVVKIGSPVGLESSEQVKAQMEQLTISSNTFTKSASNISFSKSKLLEDMKNLCRTEDQRAVLDSGIEIIDESRPYIVQITAPRGRGKSAVMGLIMAYAISKLGVNMYVVAMHIESIQTIFDFIISGLVCLGYCKGEDFKVSYKSNCKRRVISQLFILKGNLVIQYHHPLDEIIQGPSLFVIDEAASIPLSLIKPFLNGSLAFLVSTVGGYEGTGRIFKLKFDDFLIDYTTNKITGGKYKKGKILKLTLNEPIRYATGDLVEKWLNSALFLDTSHQFSGDCIQLSDCRLYHVDKKELFSGKTKAEQILTRLFSLFAESHYKNSPNDFQMLADAQNHEVFALIGDDTNIVCAIQIAFEGPINETMISKEGNLVPWVLYENYRNETLMSMVGVRIIRIAVNPQVFSSGYGSKALSLLVSAFENGDSSFESVYVRVPQSLSILNPIKSVTLPKVSWIASSFGISEKLMRFWTRNGFSPLCIRQAPSRVTGKHSVLVLRMIDDNQQILENCIKDIQVQFVVRFISLLGYSFKSFSPSLCLEVIHAHPRQSSIRDVDLSNDELSRLRMYSQGIISVDNVLDIFPRAAQRFFLGSNIHILGVLQQSILLMIGCQYKSLKYICNELSIEEFQLISILMKISEILITVTE